MGHHKLILAAAAIVFALFGCSSKENTESVSGLAYQWGPKHVCLPCHEQRSPIARNHNYYCTACHAGVAYATDKDVGHRGLLAKPQQPGFIEKACNQCHQQSVGKDIPYDAAFVRDVLISHGDYARNTNIPETYDQKKFRNIDEKLKPTDSVAPAEGVPSTEQAPATEAKPAQKAPSSDDDFFEDTPADKSAGDKKADEEFDEDFFLEEE